MRTSIWMLGVLTGLLAVGCSASGASDRSSVASGDRPTSANVRDDEDDDGDEDEQDLALSDVPDAVKQAALAAVPGLALTGAEQETEDGAVVYSLQGTASGRDVEVEVSAAGKVLEIEYDEDDDG